MYAPEVNKDEPDTFAPVCKSMSGDKLTDNWCHDDWKEKMGGECYNPKCEGDWLFFIGEFLRCIVVGVAIIVVAVPEGLPLAVMMSLAYS